MKYLRLLRLGTTVLMLSLLLASGCRKNEPVDEGQAAGLATADFPQITADVFSRWTAESRCNKCPDFVEDKGHYFGTNLPDNDKRALIDYLKTFE